MKFQAANVALCAILIIATPAASQPATVAATLDQTIEAYKMPAMSAVVIRNGKAEPEVARGVRRLGAPEPVRPGEMWLLGSITKSMTATMIARLVEQRKLSWSTRLDQMLPDLASTMRPEYRQSNLLDLLSHSAGLPEQLSGSESQAFVDYWFANAKSLREQRSEYVAKGLSDPPVAPPRTKNSYSNTDYLIAAAIAERATGRPYEKLMRDLVFQPLGMNSATFDKAKAGDLISYTEGRPATEKDGNPAIFNSAGQVRMTMADWAKFVVDQLQGDRGKGKLLKPQGYRILHSAYGPKDSMWGLGWEVRPRAFGRKGPALVHNGSDGNWIALMALYPDSNSGLLVATNGGYSMGGGKALEAAFRALAADIAPPAPAETAK